MVTFPSNGDTADGYLALPEQGSGPGVVLLQEWWGLVPHIVDVADRLAREGFVVLAPDLYHGKATTEPDEAAKQLMALDLERAGKEIAGAAGYLTDRDDVTGSGIGVVGFCMGGGLALWSGTIAPEITAVVSFYPALPWESLEPDWSAYAGKAVMLHFAEDDAWASSPVVQAAKKGLEAAGADVTIHEYAGTGHAFFNDTRPEVYDADAAATAWQRTVAFLHERLG